ncbi:MAG TPA: CHASE3 domain-containing protein [Acidisarcina sp.]|nr:CHASE3 domain-containing protein [Acidisarcina sp.]
MKSRTTGPIVIATLVATTFIVAGNAWLSLRSIKELDQSQNLVTHTWQVITAVERITNSFKDAETGTRGYMLTGDPLYLGPYQLAQHDLPIELETVKKLTADNPDQQERIRRLSEITLQRMQMLDKGIQEYRRHSVDPAHHATEQSIAGKAAMDQVRSIVAEVQYDEQVLLNHRVASSRNSADRARETSLLASFIDLLLILLMIRYILRERQVRIETDLLNDNLHRLQIISDTALSQLSLDNLTAELLDRLRNVLAADCTVLCLWSDGELRIQAASGASIRQGQIVPITSDSPLYRVIHRGQVASISEASSAIPIEELRGKMAAFLMLPLVISGRVQATLIAGRQEARAFSEQERDLLFLAADRIGISLDRANAYEAERAARRLAESHSNAVRILNSELEARVKLRTTELEVANQELEAFSYSVSHDLRAPLRTVDGFSLALEEDYAARLDDTARNYLGRIRSSVQRMGQLIDALLQLSRITRAELVREPIDVTRMASEVMHELEQLNPDREIEFNVEPGLQTTADPKLLRVALENLLGNAVKFTAKTAHAQISMGKEAGSGEFFLRDNGAGFDMNYVNKLFNAFQRLHGDKDFKGSGIGLATVARVIRRHHGEIRAEGKVGEGATFRFTLG